MKDKCPNCGNTYNPFKSFICPMCGHDVQGLNYSFIFEEQDKKHKKERDCYGNLRLSFGLDALFSQELFNIIKKAKSLINKGFSPSINYEKLCQDVEKWNEIPNSSKITIMSNPDDSKSQNPFDVLGLFGISKNEGKKTIVLNPLKIINEEGEGVAALTLFHELMHAAMYAGENELRGKYWYYKEEAYANAFSLKLLQNSSHYDWFRDALDFVKSQDSGYNTGASLLEESISMQSFIYEKINPDTVSLEDQNKWLNTWILS